MDPICIHTYLSIKTVDVFVSVCGTRIHPGICRHIMFHAWKFNPKPKWTGNAGGTRIHPPQQIAAYLCSIACLQTTPETFHWWHLLPNEHQVLENLHQLGTNSTFAAALAEANELRAGRAWWTRSMWVMQKCIILVIPKFHAKVAKPHWLSCFKAHSRWQQQQQQNYLSCLPASWTTHLSGLGIDKPRCKSWDVYINIFVLIFTNIDKYKYIYT